MSPFFAFETEHSLTRIGQSFRRLSLRCARRNSRMRALIESAICAEERRSSDMQSVLNPTCFRRRRSRLPHAPALPSIAEEPPMTLTAGKCQDRTFDSHFRGSISGVRSEFSAPIGRPAELIEIETETESLRP